MDRKPILNVKSLKEQVSTRRGALESIALLRAFDKFKAPDIEGRQALRGALLMTRTRRLRS